MDFEGYILREFPSVAFDESDIRNVARVLYPVFSPGGTYFLSFDRTDPNARFVHLWQFEEGKVLRGLKHDDRLYAASFLPREDQLQILTASADGKARLWSLEGELLQSFVHEGPVYSAQFSPDGQFIVTASADGTAKMWDLHGNLLADLDKHAGEVYSAEFSPDGRYICTGSEDGTARLWPTPYTIKVSMDGRYNFKSKSTEPDNRKIQAF